VGEVVWEFVNPAQDEGKVASIFELVRLEPEAADAVLAPR
jgi:hypothetical protein